MVQNRFAKQARAEGWFVEKVGSIGNRGFPDMVLIKGKRVMFVEVKTRVGRLSFLQARMIDNMVEHGAEVYVCRGLTACLEVLA